MDPNDKSDGSNPAPDEELLIIDEPATGEAPEHEEDENEADDERVVKNSDDGEDREAIRERRRQEKLERKKRKEEAIKRNNVEMEFLRKRNDELERRMMGLESHAVQKHALDIEADITRTSKQVSMAEEVMAKAMAANNGDDVIKALRIRDEARDRLNALTAAKQQFTSAQQDPQPARQQQAPAVDPVVLKHAKKFASDHDWYDPQGNNEESAIVMAIDRSLAVEGYNPRTTEYWDELKERAAKRLPEKFGAAPARQPKGGPAVASGRSGGAQQGNRQEFYISPERKQALMDMGVWDDPVLRQRYAKKYQQYDREAKERASRR